MNIESSLLIVNLEFLAFGFFLPKQSYCCRSVKFLNSKGY